MAAQVGVSHTMVGRIWRTFGLQPHRTLSFKLSPDPQFVAKVRDIVGLYINPPDHAVVFSVDEKSQIQALERAQPILPMDLGQPERRTHNYVRHGTLDLFAALNVATGKVLARCKRQHRSTDFVAFLRTSTRTFRRSSTFTSSSTTSRLTSLPSSSAGCFAIRASTSTSRRPMRPGSISSSASSAFSLRRLSGAAHTPASPSFAVRSSPTSTLTTTRASPSSGPRRPTRFSRRCAASASARRRRTPSDFFKKSSIQGTRGVTSVKKRTLELPPPSILARGRCGNSRAARGDRAAGR